MEDIVAGAILNEISYSQQALCSSEKNKMQNQQLAKMGCRD